MPSLLVGGFCFLPIKFLALKQSTQSFHRKNICSLLAYPTHLRLLVLLFSGTVVVVQSLAERGHLWQQIQWQVPPSFFSGTFTKNVMAAAPVMYCKQVLAEAPTVCLINSLSVPLMKEAVNYSYLWNVFLLVISFIWWWLLWANLFRVAKGAFCIARFLDGNQLDPTFSAIAFGSVTVKFLGFCDGGELSGSCGFDQCRTSKCSNSMHTFNLPFSFIFLIAQHSSSALLHLSYCNQNHSSSRMMEK